MAPLIVNKRVVFFFFLLLKHNATDISPIKSFPLVKAHLYVECESLILNHSLLNLTFSWTLKKKNTIRCIESSLPPSTGSLNHTAAEGNCCSVTGLSLQAVNPMDRGVQMIQCSFAWMRFLSSKRIGQKVLQTTVSAVPYILNSLLSSFLLLTQKTFL